MPRMATLLALGLIAALFARAEAPPPDADQHEAVGAPADEQAAPAPAGDPWSTVELAPSDLVERPLQRHKTVNTARPVAGVSRSRAADWLRTTAALGGVVALILLLAWGYRKTAGINLASGMRSRPLIPLEVVGRAALAPRQMVYLLRVGSRLVLIGATPDALRPLHTIDDADLSARLLGEAARGRVDSHTAEFARCLDGEAAAYPTPVAATVDETLLPDEQRLAGIREKLARTLGRLKQPAQAADQPASTVTTSA